MDPGGLPHLLSLASLFVSNHQMCLIASISPAISYLSLFSPLGCVQKQIDHSACKNKHLDIQHRRSTMGFMYNLISVVCWVSQWIGHWRGDGLLHCHWIFSLSLLENYTSDTAAGSEPWPALHNLSLRHQVVAHICLLLLTSLSRDVGVHTRGLALFVFTIF